MRPGATSKDTPSTAFTTPAVVVNCVRRPRTARVACAAAPFIAPTSG